MATENITVKIGANIREFEQKMGKVQGRMDQVGGRMQKVGGMFTKASAAVVGGAVAAGAGLYGLTSKVTENADAIAKGAERMGISTDAYQEMDFWASQNGLSQESLERAVGRLNQRMGLALDGNEKYATALERLGVDLDGVRDGTISTEDAMATSIQTLSEMENENEKAALASELFGTKLSREMLPALNDGSLSMEEAKEMAEELGLVMSQDQLEAAEAFQDAQDQIKRAAGAVAMQIGLDLMPHFEKLHEWILDNMPAIRETVVGAVESVIDKVKDIIDWWNGLSDTMKSIIPAVAAAALAFGPVVLIIGKVISAISTLTPLFKILGVALGVLTSPVGLVVAGIAALAAGFVLAYNKSETFRNFIDGLKDRFMDAWGAVVDFKDNVIDAFNGIMAFFNGDLETGIDLLRSIGLGDDTIESIYNGVKTIQKHFYTMKDKISEALAGVKEFFVNQFQGIKDWWDRDGEMILDAISTAVEWTMDAVRDAVDFGIRFVQDLIERFAPIVSGIWDTLWTGIQFLVENVWEKIQLAIGIAMDLIQGIISAGAAIIEGDWSRFGEIIADTAKSIWDRVVNFFGNMKDNALELFGELVGGAIQWFKDLWSDITTRVQLIYYRVVGEFRKTKNETILRIRELYQSVTGWFSDLWKSVTDYATDIKNDVTRFFGDLKDNAIDRTRDLWDGVTGWFSDLWTDATQTATDIKNDVTGFFGDMKDNTVDAAKDMWSGVTGFFDDIWDDATSLFDDLVKGARELPGRIGDAIKNMASHAVNGAKAMGNSLASGLENVINGVIGGLNNLLDAIGINSPIEEVEIKRFSTGTSGGDVGAGGNFRTFSTGTRNGRIAEDMLGILNDRGPGNGRGGAVQELIERNGQLLAPQGKDALVPLKRGDRIYNGAETQSLQSAGMLPRFSRGTGTDGGHSGSESKGLFSRLGDIVSNVWDFITEPKKAFDAVLNSVTSTFDGLTGFAGKFASGAFNLVKENGLSYLTDMFSKSGGLGTGKAASFMNYRMTTPYSPLSPVPGYPRSFNGGRHYGIDYGTPVGTPVHATTGGKLSSFWNTGGGKIAKLVTGQLRQFFMHMSSVQPSGSVQAGDLIGKTGNTGQWTTGPHIHWQAQQGTDVLNRNTVNPLDVLGHSRGGIFNKRHFAEIAEDGPEAVIPLSSSKRGRANQIMDSVDKRVGRDDELQMQRESNQLLEKQNNILMQILDKNIDVVLDGDSVKQKMDERDYNEDLMRRLFNGKKSGGASIV